MSVEQQVREAKGVPEAFFIIAAALDRIEAQLVGVPKSNGWSDWVQTSEAVPEGTLVVIPPEQRDDLLPADDQRARVTEADNETVIELPKPSPERVIERLGFAQHQLNLDEELGPGMAEAYGKGGPLWLYYGNREFVMGLPEDWRRKMVEDVFEFSPAEAAEMGADVLKDASPGVNADLVTEAIWNTRQ